MDRQAIVATVREVLAARRDICAAWLFGSVARDAAGPTSDVDVAVLRPGAPRPKTLADLPLDLADDLTRRLGRPVQVVDVAGAPDDLVHRVLRDGVLLLDRDPTARIRFEVASRNRYFDMTPIWQRYRKGAEGRP